MLQPSAQIVPARNPDLSEEVPQLQESTAYVFCCKWLVVDVRACPQATNNDTKPINHWMGYRISSGGPGKGVQEFGPMVVYDGFDKFVARVVQSGTLEQFQYRANARFSRRFWKKDLQLGMSVRRVGSSCCWSR